MSTKRKKKENEKHSHTFNEYTYHAKCHKMRKFYNTTLNQNDSGQSSTKTIYEIKDF